MNDYCELNLNYGEAHALYTVLGRRAKYIQMAIALDSDQDLPEKVREQMLEQKRYILQVMEKIKSNSKDKKP